MTAVVFLSSDLMFTSRLVGAAAAVDVALQCVTNAAELPAKLTDHCRLVLIDLKAPGLDLPALVHAIRQTAPQARLVAFGPHVEEASLTAAVQAGCDMVLSRGQFNKQYVELLQSAKA